MDPLTQGILGSTASQLVYRDKQRKRQLLLVSILGFLSGMFADLDVLIHSRTDPLLFLEYHRHFTHSLIFIPVGGLITALIFSFVFKKILVLNFKELWFCTTAAYATHALLDACTSYGTQLLWPFSDLRVAWNNMSIIDPLYTLPILVLVIFSVIKNKKILAYIAAFWVLMYPMFGVMQRERAEKVAQTLASSRGHYDVDISMKPSLGNVILWKSIYEYDNTYYVDAVRVAINAHVYEGETIKKLNLSEIPEVYPWLDVNSQQFKDIQRFHWFSQGFIAQDPADALYIVDMRYSALPNQIKALWGIKLDPKKSMSEYIAYEHNARSTLDDRLFEHFLLMLQGKKLH